jgi:hypothetical protein
MESRDVLPKSFSRWAYIFAGRTLEATAADVLGLNMVFHMTTVFGGERTVQAHPEPSRGFFHVSTNQVVEA